MPNCDKRRKLLGSPVNVFKHSKFRKNCKKELKSLKKRKKSFVSLQLFAMAPPAISLAVYPVPLSPLAPGAMPVLVGRGHAPPRASGCGP